MANAARHEPEAVAALRAGREDRMNRILRLPLPEPYTPSRVEVLRDRLRTKPGTPKSAKPAKAARPEKKPAKKSARKPQPTRDRAAVPAKSRTAQRPTRRSGHHGDAPRNSAQHPNPGSSRARRSRTLEGQRYG